MGEKEKRDAYREAIRERVMKAYIHHRDGLKAHGHNPYECAQIGALLVLAEEVAELVDSAEHGLRRIGTAVEQ